MTTTLAKARATQGRNPNNPRFFQINHPRVKKSAAADDAELSLVELLFQTGAQVVRQRAIVVTGVVGGQGVQRRLHGGEGGQTIDAAIGAIQGDVLVDQIARLLLLLAAGLTVLWSDGAQQAFGHADGVIHIGAGEA